MLLRTLIELHVCDAAMLHFECVPQTHSTHELKLHSKRVVFLKEVGKERHVDIANIIDQPDTLGHFPSKMDEIS